MNPVNKVALITGGKRIGAVVATALASAGVDIALVYNRSREEADETAAAVRALGRRAFAVQADVTNEQACTNAVSATVRELGRLDILINMASLYVAKPFAISSRPPIGIASWRSICARRSCSRTRPRRP